MLATYVVIQFSWWAYMLVDLNYDLYLLDLRSANLPALLPQEQQIIKGQLDEDLKRRIWMVLGEGAVFLILLVLGLRKVRSAIYSEMELARQQNNFLLSVTHELKSPLAALKLQLQTLTQRALDPDKQQAILKRSQTETERLQLLVEDLLLTARIDSGKKELRFEQVDLAQVVQEFVNSHYASEIESGTVSVQGNGQHRVKIDIEAIQSILTNLVDNAMKYGGPEVVVNVIVSSNDRSVFLTITDNGPGISESDRSKVFDRFYRAGNEETRRSKGTGLGLYIVSSLVEQMDGSISLKQAENGGSVFQVSLPAM